jgi:hypothetical protein
MTRASRKSGSGRSGQLTVAGGGPAGPSHAPDERAWGLLEGEQGVEDEPTAQEQEHGSQYL